MELVIRDLDWASECCSDSGRQNPRGSGINILNLKKIIFCPQPILKLLSDIKGNSKNSCFLFSNFVTSVKDVNCE
jgi:hypothetical protein